MEKSAEQSALETLNVLQPIISLSAERLDGLRTQCATSAEITHQEIRTLEGKLVKLFSAHLVAKKRIPPQNLPANFQGPSLQLWLQVVGLTPSIIQGICSRVASLECLKERSEHEIRSLMNEYHANEEETRRLARALHNLKRYTEVLRVQSEANSREASQSSTLSLNNDLSDLYWDSWDMQKVASGAIHMSTSSPRIQRTRAARSSVPSEEYINHNHGSSCTAGPASHSCSTTPCTPVTTIAPSSLSSSAFSPGSHPNIYSPTNSSVFSPSSTSPGSIDTGSTPPSTPPVRGKDKKFPTTPPARKKHETTTQVVMGNLQPENFPLTKSKSHESQLANRIESSSESNLVSLEQLPAKRRERLPTEPGPPSAGTTGTWDSNLSTPSSTSNPIPGTSFASGSMLMSVMSGSSINGAGSASPIIASPIKSPPLSQLHTDLNDDLDPHRTTLQVPKSPRTPTLTRSMGHMISHRFTKMFKVSTCDYCFKQVIIGYKCKECKFKCHRDCEPKVPPSCGLPTELIDVFAQSLQRDLDDGE